MFVLLKGCAKAMLIISVAEGVWRSHEAGRRKACLWISVLGSPEEQDVRFWPVQLVVHPPSRLLDAQRTPLLHETSRTDSERSLPLGIFL